MDKDQVVKLLASDLHKVGRRILELTAVQRQLYEAIQNPVSLEFDNEQFQVVQIDKNEHERWKRVEIIIRTYCNIS